MKKKIMSLLLAACLVLSLTACGECKHEQWNQATCTTPATCAECGITEGEALGHAWQEATCSAPETCYSCGETQGETLPHTYGAWEIGESDMSRTCTVCGSTDTQALDYEVAVKTMLAGKWDFLYSKSGSNSVDTYAGSPGIYAICDDDGTGSILIPITNITDNDFNIVSIDETPFSIVNVEYDSDADCYNFTIVHSDSSVALGQILVNENGSYQLTYMLDESTYMILTRNTKEDAYFAGIWASAQNGEFKTLILNEDGTLGGDYEGTWHSKALINSNNAWYSGFSIIYKDGDAYSFADGLSYICSASYDVNEWMTNGYNDGITLYIGAGYSWLNFDQLSAEEYEAIKSANEEGRELVVGTWTTDTSYWYDFNAGAETEIPGEYSMVFNPDGTLNATLMDTVDGTWSFRGAEMNGSEVNYLFDIVLGENDTYLRIREDGSLNASSMLAQDGEYYRYSFTRN